METDSLYSFPPFCGSHDNAGIAKLRSLMPGVETKAVGFATEAGLFQLLGDVAICGPGFIEHAINPMNSLIKASLHPALT